MVAVVVDRISQAGLANVTFIVCVLLCVYTVIVSTFECKFYEEYILC